MEVEKYDLHLWNCIERNFFAIIIEYTGKNNRSYSKIVYRKQLENDMDYDKHEGFRDKGYKVKSLTYLNKNFVKLGYIDLLKDKRKILIW